MTGRTGPNHLRSTTVQHQHKARKEIMASREGFSAAMRCRLLEFLIQAAADFKLRPIVKYSALSLFASRFYPSLSTTSTIPKQITSNWLLNPPRECNLQLFTLVSLWISTKIHDSRPLSLNSLKSYSDGHIKDQVFTKRDFIEAEAVLMKMVHFEIGTSNTAFGCLEELLIKFQEVAKLGEVVSFEACLDVMDLVYEDERLSRLFDFPVLLAAVVLVVAYLISIPKQGSEFPVLAWVKFVTSYREEEIVNVASEILKHIMGPSA